jgi:four helix bundle protein
VSRDHRKLLVFSLADELVVSVYRATASFPSEERFALQAQLRRAAVSTSTCIVEGCTRRTTKDYVHFLALSLGSASEVRYLLGLAHRLGFVAQDDFDSLEPRYGQLVRQLQKLIDSMRANT